MNYNMSAASDLSEVRSTKLLSLIVLCEDQHHEIGQNKEHYYMSNEDVDKVKASVLLFQVDLSCGLISKTC